LDVRVRVANGCIELLKPGGVRRQWRRSVFRSGEVVHPGQEVLITYLVNESSGGDLYVVTRFMDINSIVHIKITLAFHRDGEFVINEVKENGGSTFIGGGNSKIIDLSFE